MEVKLQKGKKLSEEQKAQMLKGFDFVASQAEGARQRMKQGKPAIVPKQDITKLMRACGRSPPPEDMDRILHKVPDWGCEFDSGEKSFCALYEHACDKPAPTEGQLIDALKALDLTGTGTLDPKQLREVVSTFGTKMAPADIDKAFEGLPRDRLGRISCQTIARHLLKGPEGIPHV
mmetsp:Transcript_60314/g.155376  ORF Transcript_60314/g.155376 Transcript_60314/m.155376 type:complete len:176 (+) Transcript_60314:63-590(+)